MGAFKKTVFLLILSAVRILSVPTVDKYVLLLFLCAMIFQYYTKIELLKHVPTFLSLESVLLDIKIWKSGP